MWVCALRITVLKSAGNFTRDECHDLNAEKLRRVKCFCIHAVRNLNVSAIFEMPSRPAGFENFRPWSIGGSDSLLRHVRSAPGSMDQSDIRRPFWIYEDQAQTIPPVPARQNRRE